MLYFLLILGEKRTSSHRSSQEKYSCTCLDDTLHWLHLQARWALQLHDIDEAIIHLWPVDVDSPWYQMAPLMVMLTRGWIIAFHKTEFTFEGSKLCKVTIKTQHDLLEVLKAQVHSKAAQLDSDIQTYFPSTSSSPHRCSALEEDQVSTGVPPQHDSSSPMGYFRVSYKYRPKSQHTAEKLATTSVNGHQQNHCLCKWAKAPNVKHLRLFFCQTFEGYILFSYWMNEAPEVGTDQGSSTRSKSVNSVSLLLWATIKGLTSGYFATRMSSSDELKTWRRQ